MSHGKERLRLVKEIKRRGKDDSEHNSLQNRLARQEMNEMNEMMRLCFFEDRTVSFDLRFEVGGPAQATIPPPCWSKPSRNARGTKGTPKKREAWGGPAPQSKPSKLCSHQKQPPSFSDQRHPEAPTSCKVRPSSQRPSSPPRRPRQGLCAGRCFFGAPLIPETALLSKWCVQLVYRKWF